MFTVSFHLRYKWKPQIDCCVFFIAILISHISGLPINWYKNNNNEKCINIQFKYWMQTHCNVNIVLEIFIESENGDVIPVTSICILFHLRFKKKLLFFILSNICTKKLMISIQFHRWCWSMIIFLPSNEGRNIGFGLNHYDLWERNWNYLKEIEISSNGTMSMWLITENSWKMLTQCIWICVWVCEWVDFDSRAR